MRAFPITEVLDEQACYEFLVRVLHPKGRQCPAGHRVASGQAPHMSDRAPVVDYRCRQCGKVFNVFTNTLWRLDFGQLSGKGEVWEQESKDLLWQLHAVRLGSGVHQIASPPNLLAHQG